MLGFIKLFLTIFMALVFTSMASANEEAIDVQVRSDQDSAGSQTRINKLDNAAADALQAYRVALQRAESLTIYNRQLQRLIDSQGIEIVSIKRQTSEIESIETGTLPLILEMTATLAEMLSADSPFLVEERSERVDNLKALIDRADVSVGEKYRRIMEAYMIEADYGRTIEAYTGDLVTDNVVRSVDFLRIGRIGLYYQTLDGSETGAWNKSSSSWKVLPIEFRRPVRDGLSIARKQAPPKLLELPIIASGNRK
ncbi:MAG: hypothetical protein CMK36_05545 [Porticoccaceae bacterium]|nr:hypothetical protein [Porticoccaceae bacterium]